MRKIKQLICKMFGCSWEYFFTSSSSYHQRTDIRTCKCCGKAQHYMTMPDYPDMIGTTKVWMNMTSYTKQGAKNKWGPNALKAVTCLIMLIIPLSGCESKQNVQTDIDCLKHERTELSVQIQTLSYQVNSKQAEVSVLDSRLKELKIYDSGKIPKYILKMHLKQSHFSLDIDKHIKDAMNAIDFEMPVDRDFYNSVAIGTVIVDQFRTGSFILYGSMGDWKMTVNGKEIR